MNHIKDIKELKDTWREDGDRMYESMDRLLESMESMRQYVVRVSGGLSDLDQGRSVISGNRKQIESLSTQAIADLNSVTQQTAVLIPYLETAKNAVTEDVYKRQVLELSIEHRRIAGCDLRPVRPSFPASGFATFTEDISISLRRALADATPSFPA